MSCFKLCVEDTDFPCSRRAHREGLHRRNYERYEANKFSHNATCRFGTFLVPNLPRQSNVLSLIFYRHLLWDHLRVNARYIHNTLALMVWATVAGHARSSIEAFNGIGRPVRHFRGQFHGILRDSHGQNSPIEGVFILKVSESDGISYHKRLLHKLPSNFGVSSP